MPPRKRYSWEWVVPDSTAYPGARRRSAALRATLTVVRCLPLALVSLVAMVALILALAPRVLPFRAYAVLSGSMAPALPAGALIVLAPIDSSEVGVGNVIAFEQPGKPGRIVTHRVVRIESSSTGRVLVTRGDANNAEDAWRIPAEGRGWRVRFHVPQVGRLTSMLQTPVASLALVVAPATALAALCLRDIWRPARQVRNGA